MEATPSGVAISATEIRWERTYGDLLQVFRVKVWDESGKSLNWRVGAYPWWMDLERHGHSLRLNMRHEGNLRGHIKLAVGDLYPVTFSVRVMSHLLPTPEASVAGGRRGLVGAILGQLASLFLVYLLLGPMGSAIRMLSDGLDTLVLGLAYLVGFAAAAWLPGALWGYMVGGGILSWRSGVGTLLGLPLGALATYNLLELGLKELVTGPWGPVLNAAGASVGGLLAGWAWSTYLGGGPWLRRRSAYAGAGAALVWYLTSQVGRATAGPGEPASWVFVALGATIAAAVWGSYLGANLGRPTLDQQSAEPFMGDV